MRRHQHVVSVCKPEHEGTSKVASSVTGSRSINSSALVSTNSNRQAGQQQVVINLQPLVARDLDLEEGERSYIDNSVQVNML